MVLPEDEEGCWFEVYYAVAIMSAMGILPDSLNRSLFLHACSFTLGAWMGLAFSKVIRLRSKRLAEQVRSEVSQE